MGSTIIVVQRSLPFEFFVDQVCQREADEHLKEECPEQEMRCGLHIQPDVAVTKDAFVIAGADPLDLAISVSFEIGKAKPDGPDQREDIDRQQQEDRRAHEDPRNGAIAEPFDLACDALRCSGSGAGGGSVWHWTSLPEGKAQ